MTTYLILYGEDNEMATFEAETPDAAIMTFNDWQDVPEGEETAINHIYECREIPLP